MLHGVQDQGDGDPECAEVEAFHWVVQRACEGAGVHDEACDYQRAEEEEEHDVNYEDDFADCAQAGEGERLLAE